MSDDPTRAPSRLGGVVQVVGGGLGALAIVFMLGHPDLGSTKGLAMLIAGISVVGFLLWNGIATLRRGAGPQPLD